MAPLAPFGGCAMEGKKLIDNIALLTGLPYQLVERELKGLIKKSSSTTSAISLAQIREILSEYLQDVIIEAKKEDALKEGK